jgi:hypothetical protein
MNPRHVRAHGVHERGRDVFVFFLVTRALRDVPLLENLDNGHLQLQSLDPDILAKSD